MVKWDSDTDWNNAQHELGVHHEQPPGTDWATTDKVEKGWPSYDEGEYPDYNESALGGYWPCDDDSGTTVVDVSSNNNDGTAENSPIFNTTPAPLGTTAIDLEGGGDIISVPNDASISPSNAITIVGWFNAATGTTPSDFFSQFITKGGSGSPMDYGIGWRDTDNHVYFRIRTGSSTEQTIASMTPWSPSDGWTMWGGVYDGSNMYLYKDGHLETSRQWSGTIQQSGLDLGFGGNPTSDTTTPVYFEGQISDIRLYSRALSARAMEDLYRATQ